MRELEFLPQWYPVLRRRRGLAVTQAWATAVVLGSLCLFGVAEHHRVMANEATSDRLQREMVRTRAELRTLDEQLELKRQLEHQSLILSKVGIQVEATRLLGELSHLMGGEMFLIELNLETEETIKAAAAANNSKSGALEKSANASDEQVSDRKLKVRLICVAPSDVDVANFLAGLTNKSFLQQVAMTYAKDRIQGGRVMREFELTFLINLNSPSAE